jgi:hypothetical protein
MPSLTSTDHARPDDRLSKLAPFDREHAHIAARRIIGAVRDWNAPVRLPYLFTEIGIDLETSGFDEMLAILIALDDELDCDEYPEDFKQRIRFAAPFARADAAGARPADKLAAEAWDIWLRKCPPTICQRGKTAEAEWLRQNCPSLSGLSDDEVLAALSTGCIAFYQL